MTNTDTKAFIDTIKGQLENAPDGVDTSALTAAIDAMAGPEEERVKIVGGNAARVYNLN